MRTSITTEYKMLKAESANLQRLLWEPFLLPLNAGDRRRSPLNAVVRRCGRGE